MIEALKTLQIELDKQQEARDKECRVRKMERELEKAKKELAGE